MCCVCYYRSCAAYILSQFVQQAISGDLPVEYGAPPSNAVIGSLVYVCRQLYSTCEGLFVLYPYDLHSVIAQAWKVVGEKILSQGKSTVNPGIESCE